ncbi:MAG: asparagine synthase (glutamine-hydrolyzing) [Bacteroidales bacterium]|nr:asparagine synthase (glutamine-hydrolyzing) [Bacteroidales bacterium]
MCGINGFFSNKNINKIEERIRKMNHAISHRGPDANKYEIFDNYSAFGHLRLSIIDTDERSHQPMFSNSGRYTIVFNGEIYNFKELKKEVDYPFKTESDTELILAYIETKGLDNFLSKCNGMFAFALYDHVKKQVILVRDRLGIKPLYYYFENGLLIFSSEINGILNSGLIEPEFNELAIDDYLAYRYVREPYTFFSNIKQLEAGYFISFSKGRVLSKQKYWQIPDELNTNSNYSENDIKKEFKTQINSAINRRLMSDVALGTYLSGGIDSSLITAITAKKINKPLNTYTIGFEDLNEFEYANMVAKKYKTNHHEIVQKREDYFSLTEEVILYKGAPLSVPNEIPLSQMSKVLKKDITVVLSGEGADELMGGYGKIFRSAFDFKNHIFDQSFYKYFRGLYEYTPRKLRDEFILSKENYRTEFDDKINYDFANHSNEENIFRFFHKYHIKGLLGRLDTTTMLASVEARVPFLDHELIEFSYNNIPYNLKLKWKSNSSKETAKAKFAREYSELLDIPKYLLRELAYEHLPENVVDRKKMGFPVPLNKWFNLISEKALVTLSESSWLNTKKLDELVSKTKSNERFGQILWMFMNIEVFKQLFFNRKWKY